jgi:AraC-like DNA-binding protein
MAYHLHMVISVSLLTIFLSVIAFWFNWERNRATLFLAATLILYSLFIITNKLFLTGESIVLIALFTHINSAFLLAGPLLYFYFRALTEDRIRFRGYDILHFMPFIVSLIGSIPFIISPWSNKIEVAQIISDNIHNFKNQNFNLLMPIIWQQTFRSISYFLYAFASLFLVIRFRNPITVSPEPISMEHYHNTRIWAIVVLLSVLISSGAYFVAVRLFLGDDETTFDTIGPIWLQISAIIYTMIPASLLIYPNVIYGFVRLRDDAEFLSDHNLNTKPYNSFNLGDTSDVSDAQNNSNYLPTLPKHKEIRHDDIPEDKNKDLMILKSAIIAYLVEKKPYLKENFRIADISASLEVPAHHISYCFNKAFDESFTQIRTRYRVEHAKRMLEQGATDQYSIEGIGKMSGFASKSSFFTYFKEFTGLTPQQYVNSLKTLKN